MTSRERAIHTLDILQRQNTIDLRPEEAQECLVYVLDNALALHAAEAVVAEREACEHAAIRVRSEQWRMSEESDRAGLATEAAEHWSMGRGAELVAESIRARATQAVP